MWEIGVYMVLEWIVCKRIFYCKTNSCFLNLKNDIDIYFKSLMA